MSMRHIAQKETLDRGYASEWNDDHMENFATRIETRAHILSESLIDHFDLAQENTATPTAITIVNGVAAIRFIPFGGINRLSSIRLMLGGAAGNVTNLVGLPIANMAVELGGLTGDNNTHQFGLVDSPSIPFNPLDDGAFFRISNNIISAVTSDGAVETETVIGAPNQFGNYRIEFNSTDVRFYIDDLVNPVAVHTTNIPIVDLTFKFTTALRAGGANTMSVQSFALSVLRDA